MHICFSILKGFNILGFIVDSCGDSGYTSGNGVNDPTTGCGEIELMGDGMDCGDLYGDGSGDTNLDEEYGDGEGDGTISLWPYPPFFFGLDIEF